MLADWIDEYLSNLEVNLQPLEDFVKDTSNYDFIANGPSYSSAFQAGLVFREGPKVITATNNCADYAHGWDKSAQAGYMGLIHAPGYDSDSVEARMLNSLLDKGAKVILITDVDIKLSKDVYVVKHPEVFERLAPLPQIIVTSALMGWLMGEKSDRE
jgi:fructoselysine-6-P-deglycase FrlB-like protein